MTSDQQRREVAAKLRETCDEIERTGNGLTVWELTDILAIRDDDSGMIESLNLDDARNLADLIEPEERTCRMGEVKTGEVADYRDTDEIIFHCKSCHTERGIFSYDEDGNVYSARPEYCPNCGAKVVDDD